MDNRSDHGRHDPPQGYGPSGLGTLGGLSVDADRLRFVPSNTCFTPGTSVDWSFQIVSSNGVVVTDFDEAHGQRNHLIVVRRDLTRFQHLHPTLDGEETWGVKEFTLHDPGVYRAFADLFSVAAFRAGRILSLDASIEQYEVSSVPLVERFPWTRCLLG